MDIKVIMKNAGIVGAGGAGFPSFMKLAEGADTLVVNGAECEPLLYTDYVLLETELDTVLRGISEVINYVNIPRALMCVKQHTAERLGWTDGQRLADKIFVKELPNVYPMGDEISLIYQATGRVVRAGNLPITSRVIVYNVETLYNIARAVDGHPLTMKWFTIGGNVREPIVVCTPIGTRLSDVFRKYGITVPAGHTVLDGGPSMGKIINVNSAIVTKTTKGILILPDTSPAIESKRIDAAKATARAETACCQCTRCTDLCPRHLLGYPLEPHKMVRTAAQAVAPMPVMVLSATLCCGCGICETLACCQGISPRAVIANYKELLGKNRMRYAANVDATVSAEREYRMVSSHKWETVLGVEKYDRVAKFVGTDTDFERFEILLSQHIGAPSVTRVSVGDSVNAGDVIAEAGEGLSLPQHASVSGRISYVDQKKIIIDRG